MEEFKIEGEYIQLVQFLKAANWVESGGLAGAMILDGMVIVNDEVDTRKRKKLRAGDTVKFEGREGKMV